MVGPEMDPYHLHACKGRNCERSTSADFCCHPCSGATNYGYEIDAHSKGCEQRHAARSGAFPTPATGSSTKEATDG